MKIKKASGFSLIEILVVIMIIGILSTFIIVSLGGARAKARDAKRKNDLATIGRFLSLSCFMPTGGAGEYDLVDLVAELLVSNPTYSSYLKNIPIDPLSGTIIQSNYIYTINAEGDKCALYANLENENENITLSNLTEPTPGRGSGVLQGTNTGINNTNIYFQYSN